jgi:hypothetical protein
MGIGQFIEATSVDGAKLTGCIYGFKTNGEDLPIMIQAYIWDNFKQTLGDACEVSPAFNIKVIRTPEGIIVPLEQYLHRKQPSPALPLPPTAREIFQHFGINPDEDCPQHPGVKSYVCFECCH